MRCEPAPGADEWERPEQEASFSAPGSYVALVAGASLPIKSNGFLLRYASAHRVIPPTGQAEVLTQVIGHEEAASSNQRGYIAAVALALETLPAESVITLLSREAFIVGALNDWLQAWPVKKWRGSDKKPIQHQDIWKRVLRVMAERRLVVAARYERKGESLYDSAFDALTAEAQAEARRIFDPM